MCECVNQEGFYISSMQDMSETFRWRAQKAKSKDRPPSCFEATNTEQFDSRS